MVQERTCRSVPRVVSRGLAETETLAVILQNNTSNEHSVVDHTRHDEDYRVENYSSFSRVTRYAGKCNLKSCTRAYEMLSSTAEYAWRENYLSLRAHVCVKVAAITRPDSYRLYTEESGLSVTFDLLFRKVNVVYIRWLLLVCQRTSINFSECIV